MSSRRQRSISLGGRYRQVSLYVYSIYDFASEHLTGSSSGTRSSSGCYPHPTMDCHTQLAMLGSIQDQYSANGSDNERRRYFGHTKTKTSPGGPFDIKMPSYQYRNLIFEIRWSYDHGISTMGFPIPLRLHLYIWSVELHKIHYTISYETGW